MSAMHILKVADGSFSGPESLLSSRRRYGHQREVVTQRSSFPLTANR